MAQGSAEDVRTADRLRDACNLDQAKLQSSNAALYLVTFLDNLETQLALADASLIEQCLRDLETCLSTLVTTANTPISAIIGRPVRRSMARIYTLIFEKRDGRGLFDSVRSWLEAAGEAKGSMASRLLAFHLISENLQSHGNRITSILPDVWQTSSRTMRHSGVPVILRAAACRCGQSTLLAQAPITNESLAREALKILKQMMAEKSCFLQRAAADSLSALFTSSTILQTLPEVDTTISACIKALDCAPWTTRRSIVGLVVTLSILTQIGSAGSQVTPSRDEDGFTQAEGQKGMATARTTTTPRSCLSSPDDMLSRLSSHYHRTPSASTRNAIAQIYATLIHRLGYTFVENYHQLLLRHLFTVLGSGLQSQAGSYQTLLLRHYIHLIVGELVAKRLTRGDMYTSRIGQVVADYLEPALQTVRNPEAVTSALQYVSSLLLEVGTYGQDDFSEQLFQTLASLSCSTSASVRGYATRACTILLIKSPSAASTYISELQESLTDDLQAVEEAAGRAEVLQRIEGRALLLASLIATAASCPLYVPMDAMNRLMSLATRILRGSSEHPLAQALVEVQAAWHLVDGLVNLGHGFTSIHLPQLLLLWKNAIPKPSAKDSAVDDSRTAAEWEFLLGIRQSALKSLSSFICSQDAADLITADVTRRILNILRHGLAFLGQASTAILERPASGELSATLVDALLLYQVRLFAFATALLQQSITLPTDMALDLSLLCSSVISGRHKLSSHLRSVALRQIPTKTASLWELADFAPPTLNSILNHGMVVDAASPSCDSNAQEDTVEFRLESMSRKPALPALEHDVQACITSSPMREQDEATPASVQCVNRAIRLLAQLFPLASDHNRLRIISSLRPDPATEPFLPWHHEAENRANVLAACQEIVQALVKTRKRGVLIAEGVLHELSKRCMRELGHRDILMREAAAAGLGGLCDLTDRQFLSNGIQASVAYVVSETCPDGRAGRASAFAQIYRSVGTLAAAPALKVIVEVLLSLATDPHPIVRYWAIRALAKIVLTAGLDFSPYIKSTTTVILQLYMEVSSEPDGASANVSSLHATYSTYEAVSELLTAVIGLLGPGSGASDMLIAASTAMVRQFLNESDTTIIIAANKTLQSLLIVLPHTIPLPVLVKVMQDQLAFAETAIKASAIASVYQLVQRDVSAMSTLGGSSFVEGLFRLLDDDPQIYGVQLAIHSWLDQTGAQTPQGWIDISRRVMQRGSKSRAEWVDAPKGQILEDEESVGLGVTSTDPQRHEATRWTTQVFALQCLTRLLSIMRDAKPAITSVGLPNSVYTQEDAHVLARLPDLMRIAFISTNSDTLEVQLAGLELLRLIIHRFSPLRDPSSLQTPLLEQFQASIVSALASVLNDNDCVELLSVGLLVSGEYISSRAIQQTAGIKRLAGPLVERLQLLQDAHSSTTNNIEVKEVNYSAADLIQGSMLHAWALIAQAACESSGAHLLHLLQPHWNKLQIAWVSLLRARALSAKYGEGSASFQDAHASVGKPKDLYWLSILKATLLPHAESLRQSASFSTESDVPILLGMVVEELYRLINTWSNSAIQIQSGSEALQCLQWLAQVATAQYGSNVIGPEIKDEIIRICWRLHYLQAPPVDAHLPGIILAWWEPQDRCFPSEIQQSIIKLLLRLIVTSPSVSAEAWQALLEIATTLCDDDRSALISITWLSFFNVSQETATRSIEPPLLRAFSQSMVDWAGGKQAHIVHSSLQGLSTNLMRRTNNADDTEQAALGFTSRTLRILYLIVTSLPATKMSSEALLDKLVSIFDGLARNLGASGIAAQAVETEVVTAWKVLLRAAVRTSGRARWIILRSVESLTASLLSKRLCSNAEVHVYDCLSVISSILGDLGVTYLLSINLYFLLGNHENEQSSLRNRSTKDFRMYSTLYLDDIHQKRSDGVEQDSMLAKLTTAKELLSRNPTIQLPHLRRQPPAISLRVFS